MPTEHKKKIFITISRGWLARNYLQNDFYKILRECFEIGILTPAAHDERFTCEFGHKNVRFFMHQDTNWTMADRVMHNLHRLLIWNPSVDIQFRYGYLHHHQVRSNFKYYLTKIIFLPLSKLTFLRSIVRWIDETFVQRAKVAEFSALLQRERPDLVISTNIIDDGDVALLKAAKKLGITTLAAPKSWDNPSKTGFRVRMHHLVMWNEYMRECAHIYQGYRDQELFIPGVLQYDLLRDSTRYVSYEKFCANMGLSSDRKTLLFGSEGKYTPHDREITTMLHEMIMRNEFVFPCQLIIRPHYAHPHDAEKFTGFIGKPFVVVDMFNNPSKNLKDSWDYSDEFTNRFLNSMRHSAIIINTCSTLSLDAAADDKPIIAIAFDGNEKLPYAKSIARFYDKDYSAAVAATGALTKVYSREELRDAINTYLKDPTIKARERGVLRSKFCGTLDGKSGARYAEFVTQLLSQ